MDARQAQLPRQGSLPPLGPGPIDVVGFGENSVDVLATVPRWPAPNDKVELRNLATLPGGQVASALVACARLGCRAHYIGVFGDDPTAGLARDTLIREGVNVEDCLEAAAPNRSALIIVDPAAGTRTVLWRRDPALDWPADTAVPPAVASAKLALVDAADLAASVRIARQARAAGVPVVLDVDRDAPGVADILANVDVIIAAQGFAEAHTGEPSQDRAMEALHAAYRPTAVIVTLGAAGAVAWDGRRAVVSPGFAVTTVDPTGAGDAFRGGFLWAWLAAGEGTARLEDLLRAGNATAALNCQAAGAQGGLPTRPELEAFLTETGGSRSNPARPASGTGASSASAGLGRSERTRYGSSQRGGR